jgi:hypothetical protein
VNLEALNVNGTPWKLWVTHVQLSATKKCGRQRQTGRSFNLHDE